MGRKMGLTPALIEEMVPSSVSDSATPGLFIKMLGPQRHVWKYRRKVSGSAKSVKMTLGPYPARSIAEARNWARAINQKIEIGIDPREERSIEQSRAEMTVAKAHQLYMDAVREGR